MAFKFFVPVLIILTSLLLAWFLTSKLTLGLEFSKVFKSDVLPDPQTKSEGISVVLKGVDGDSAVVGFGIPGTDHGSETLNVTEKNLDEIKSSLDNLEIEKWEFLTNLPPSIFRFDVLFSSFPDSPNNAKKDSHYLVENYNGVTHKVLPGETIYLAKSSKISDLPNSLSKVKVKLIYENGLYQNFYNQNGDLVSQATGELIIKPTIALQGLLILGALAFVVASLLLLKQTLMSSQDVMEVVKYFKSNS